MSQELELLTLGQASCLVLGLPPSVENRKKAKKIINDAKVMEVTYKRLSDPFEPILIGKRVKYTNPFKYRSYNNTPPPSPKSFDDHISIASTEPHEIQHEESLLSADSQENISIPKDTTLNISSSSKESNELDSSEDIDEQLDKENIIELLKSIAQRDVPNQVGRYTYMWLGAEALLDIVKCHLYVEYLTAVKLEKWITESGIFGKISERVTTEGLKLGRYLYLLKQKYRDSMLQ